MRPIPLKDKNILKEFKQECARCGSNQVQWHHPFTYAGRQLTEWWATVFACVRCHAMATPHNNKFKLEVKEFFEYAVLKPHLISLVMAYPKGTWVQLFNYLNKKYAFSNKGPTVERKPNLQERKRTHNLPK